MMKKALTQKQHICFHFVNGKKRKGIPEEIRGNLTDISGDLTDISGDLSGVYGSLNGVRGDLTGVRGDLTDVRGDLTDCDISNEDREARIDIKDLILN